MYDGCKAIETTVEVWRAIYDAHKDDLVVAASFSDPAGAFGKPQMYTAWSLKGHDWPLIEMETTWERGPNDSRVNKVKRCWLLSAIKSE